MEWNTIGVLVLSVLVVVLWLVAVSRRKRIERQARDLESYEWKFKEQRERREEYVKGLERVQDKTITDLRRKVSRLEDELKAAGPERKWGNLPDVVADNNQLKERLRVQAIEIEDLRETIEQLGGDEDGPVPPPRLTPEERAEDVAYLFGERPGSAPCQEQELTPVEREENARRFREEQERDPGLPPLTGNLAVDAMDEGPAKAKVPMGHRAGDHDLEKYEADKGGHGRVRTEAERGFLHHQVDAWAEHQREKRGRPQHEATEQATTMKLEGAEEARGPYRPFKHEADAQSYVEKAQAATRGSLTHEPIEDESLEGAIYDAILTGVMDKGSRRACTEDVVNASSEVIRVLQKRGFIDADDSKGPVAQSARRLLTRWADEGNYGNVAEDECTATAFVEWLEELGL